MRRRGVRETLFPFTKLLTFPAIWGDEVIYRELVTEREREIEETKRGRVVRETFK